MLRRPSPPLRVLSGWLALGIALSLQASARAQTPAPAAEPPPVVSLRVQQRARYDVIDNSPRLDTRSSDQALELQTSLFVEAGRGSVRFNGELFDARTELNGAQSFLSTNHVNTLEPLQVNVSWNFSALLRSGYAGSLKVGRFTTDVGKRRLVSRSNTRNTITSYTGAEWRWRAPDGRNALVFWGVPMRNLPSDKPSLLDNERELDLGNRGTSLRGAYYQFAPIRKRDWFEVYWFGLDQPNRPSNDALPRHFDSLGFRSFRPNAPGKWSYEVEAVKQHGTSSATVGSITRRDLVHDAEFYHWEFGYTFASKLVPVVLLQYDRASGDKDPFDGRNGTFDTLFGERRFDFVPQGLYSLFARSNLRTPGVRLTFNSTPRLQSMFSYRSYSLDAPRDAWSGVGYRDVTGHAGSFVGRQLEGSFTWRAIPGRLTAFRGNPVFVYTMLTTSFGRRYGAR
jgi:hypothetical protein